MKKMTIKLYSIILCASMVCLSACSAGLNGETDKLKPFVNSEQSSEQSAQESTKRSSEQSSQESSEESSEQSVEESSVQSSQESSEQSLEESSSDTGRYSAYLEEVRALIKEYGKGKIIVDDTNGNNAYKMTGLCYAKLIDFNNDGNEELLCVYGPTKDGDGYEKSYYMKVFGYDGSNVNILFESSAYYYGGTEFGVEYCYKIAYCEDNGQTLLLTRKNPMTFIIREWSKFTGTKFEIVKSFSDFNDSDPGNTVCTVDDKEVSTEEFNKQLAEWENKQTYIIFNANSNSKDIFENNINETNDTLKTLGYVEDEKKESDNTEMYAVYLNKVKELINKYGEANVSSMGYYIGVPVVRLIDFDGNGIEELYCVYSEDNLYYANKQEVFGYIDDAVVSIFKSDVNNYGTSVEPFVNYLTCSDKTYLLTDSALQIDFSSSVWSELNANQFKSKISYSIRNNGTTMNEDLVYTVDGKEVMKSDYQNTVDSFIEAGTQTIYFMSQSQDQDNSIILITNETLELLGYTSSVSEWKQLYIDAVKSDYVISDYAGYALVNVDDDGIPELVCFGGDVAHGLIIAWIKDGEVVYEQLGYSSFSYYPNENRFCASYVNHGIYKDTVYEFQNKSLVKLYEGEPISEENSLISVFYKGQSVSVTYSNRDEIVNIINNY